MPVHSARAGVEIVPAIPPHLHILLTNRCNFNCNYCEFDCKEKGVEIPFDDLKKLLTEARKLGITSVGFNGGEPFIYSRLEETLRFCMMQGLKVMFVTNAWFIPENIGLLKKFNVREFYIGLDGMDAETNDKIRGKKGSFDRVMQSVDLLKKEGMTVALNYLVIKDNYKQVERFFEYMIDKKIDSFQLIPLIKHAGRARFIKDQYLTKEQEAEVREVAKKYEPIFKKGTAFLSTERTASSCKYLSYDQMCFDWDGAGMFCSLAVEENSGWDFPKIRDNSLLDIILKLRPMSARLDKLKHTEWLTWEEDERLMPCGFCIEQMKEKKDFIKGRAVRKFDGDLLITTACPNECEFCIYRCTKDGEYMPEDLIEKVAREYTENDIGIRICGGEPFMDQKKLGKCLDIVLKHQKPEEIQVITGGHFASDEAQTKKALKILSERKLDTVVVSMDRFHLKNVPISNIMNIIDEAKKQAIRVNIRFTIDEESYAFAEQIAELIAKHEVNFEPHFSFALMGNAESLDPKLISDQKKRKEHFVNSLNDSAKRYGRDNIWALEQQSPKRSQRYFGKGFFPTTFPSGAVFADSQCCKGSYMGNLKETTLKEMTDEFQKTLPGYILLSERSDCCSRMPKLLPEGTTDFCEFCRSQPFGKDIPNEAIGRITVFPSKENDFGNSMTLPDDYRELLLAFELTEQDLNQATGRMIDSFLDTLIEKKRRFKVARPLPPCLFGFRAGKIAKRFSLPKDCYGCSELFTVENEEIISCRALGKKGPKIWYMEDRKEIFSYFKAMRNEKKLMNICTTCLYSKRGQCDGLCYRR
jgi:MoaA/NifB/PqqE/SkfB family radical SAM enzyme